MPISTSLPQCFWAEALSTACYIINRAMIHPKLEKTAYELLKGRKPNISHLRFFGCKCFVHNNGKDNLGKFDVRSNDTIFLGYSLHSCAYRVFNKRLLKIEESIHVSFDENRNGNDALVDLEEEEFLFQVDESMGPSNSFVDDEVVSTIKDDVPKPATDAQEVPETENDQ